MCSEKLAATPSIFERVLAAQAARQDLEWARTRESYIRHLMDLNEGLPFYLTNELQAVLAEVARCEALVEEKRAA